MRRRDKAGSKAAKLQRPKTLKRRNAPKVAHRRKPSAADVDDKIALLEHKLNEALEPADGHLRNSEGDQQLARPLGAGIQRDAGKGGAHLRSQVRCPLAL